MWLRVREIADRICIAFSVRSAKEDTAAAAEQKLLLFSFAASRCIVFFSLAAFVVRRQTKQRAEKRTFCG